MSIQTTTEIQTTQADKKPLISTLWVVLGVVAVIGLASLFIWLIIWLAQISEPSKIGAIRDIFIIALALESCLFGVVLMILVIMVIRLVNMMEFEIKPLLEKTNETVGMVRGTTAFVSQNVVKPVTTASSYIAGIRRGLKTLFGDPRKNLSD